MKKQSKILNLIFILVVMFSTFICIGGESFAFAAPNAVTQTVDSKQQSIPDANKPATIPEKNAYNLTHMEKHGFGYGLLKFLTAILGVIISSVAIFFGLKLYQKFILKNNSSPDNIDYDKTLESPKDFKEAINLFLDKTDK